MRHFVPFVTAVSLSVSALAAAPAAAQSPAAAAPAPVTLSVGTKTFDVEGNELGSVSSIVGDNAVVDLGDGKQVTLPQSAFGMLEKGPTIGATKAQVVAAVDQAAASADTKLAAALQVGADVKSAHGAAVVGKVKTIETDGVILATAKGDVKLPRTAFFAGPEGLATSFTEEQFAAAIAEAVPTPAPAATETAAEAGASAADTSGE